MYALTEGSDALISLAEIFEPVQAALKRALKPPAQRGPPTWERAGRVVNHLHGWNAEASQLYLTIWGKMGQEKRSTYFNSAIIAAAVRCEWEFAQVWLYGTPRLVLARGRR